MNTISKAFKYVRDHPGILFILCTYALCLLLVVLKEGFTVKSILAAAMVPAIFSMSMLCVITIPLIALAIALYHWSRKFQSLKDIKYIGYTILSLYFIMLTLILTHIRM
jgi:hypothetical protein